MPLWPQNDHKGDHGLLTSRRTSFRRQQQSDLHADQGRASPLMGGRWGPNPPMQGTRTKLPPTVRIRLPSPPLHARLNGRRPKHESLGPGMIAGSARQRITSIFSFLSNSIDRTPTLRAGSRSHPCPPAGLGPLAWYHLECPSRHLCLLVGLPQDGRSSRALLGIRITASDS